MNLKLKSPLIMYVYGIYEWKKKPNQFTEKAMAALPSKVAELQNNISEEDHSPVTPLPIYQQRDNFFS